MSVFLDLRFETASLSLDTAGGGLVLDQENGTPSQVTDDPYHDRCMELASGDSIYHSVVIDDFASDQGFYAANFKTSSNTKQVIFGWSRTSGTYGEFSLWVDDGAVGAKLRRDGVDVWELATDLDTYDDGEWHRAAISGGPDGPQLWIDGALAAATFATGDASNTEWTSNLVGVASAVNRLSIGCVRIALTNESPFIGRLTNCRASTQQPTAEIMLADYRNTLQAFDVFVIAGQSNNMGREGPIDGGLDATDPRITQYGRDGGDNGNIVLAADPLQHSGVTSDTVGPGLSLGKAWLAEHAQVNRRVLLIPVAVGNTGFRNGEWLVGGNQYNDLINRTTAAFNKIHPASTLCAITMQLGENDAAGNTAQREAYTPLLIELIKTIRIELFDQTPFPLILGTMPQTWVDTAAGYQIVQDQILAMESKIPNCVVVDATDLASETVGDIHYSAASSRTLGQRHGAAAIAHVSVPNYAERKTGVGRKDFDAKFGGESDLAAAERKIGIPAEKWPQ
jgi:hypothetical protein